MSNPFSIVEPYQRLWTDLLAQIGRWAGLGLSLRQMQTEIGEQMQSQVGLYPQTGRWGILAWHLAGSESQTAWEQLLAPLEVRGSAGFVSGARR